MYSGNSQAFNISEILFHLKFFAQTTIVCLTNWDNMWVHFVIGITGFYVVSVILFVSICDLKMVPWSVVSFSSQDESYTT